MNHDNVESLLARVADRFGVSVDELKSKDRHKSISQARHAAIWVLRKARAMSYPELGRALGNRDHTTAMNAFRRIERQREQDHAFAALLDTLIASPVLRKTTMLDELEWLCERESMLNQLDETFMQPESEVRTA